MEIRKITDDYAVSAQIASTDIAAIKAAGYRSVVCNRPDAEDPGQPTADQIRRDVEAAGLAFRWLPVVSGQITEQNVRDQAKALAELEGPVFAYCRSGARCTNLYMMAQQSKG